MSAPFVRSALEDLRSARAIHGAARRHTLIESQMTDITTPEDVQATPDIEGTAPEAAEQTFADFDVNPQIVAALADAGIVHPFPIQAMTLPVALGGHDIIGQAKTGTGKTLGFGIPMLNRIDLESLSLIHI